MSDYFIYRKEWLPMRGSLIGGGGKKIINVDRDVFKPLFYNKQILSISMATSFPRANMTCLPQVAH